MTIKQEIVNWNNSWRYDFWWRQKYKIAYGSEAHRSIDQISIAFEYFENDMYSKAVNGFKEEDKKKKKYEETGSWISESKLDSKEADRLWEKLDINNLKNL